MILKTLFQKYKYIILTPYTEVLDGKFFSNYRWEKYGVFQTPFKNTGMNVTCRMVGKEVEKW